MRVPSDLKKTGEPYYDLLLSDLDFSIQYLSVYCPFKEHDVLSYWDVLCHGEAYYSVYLPDTESVYSPTLGLCFNQNMYWTAQLRAKWEVGFNNPYMGYIQLGNKLTAEYDDSETLKNLLPLSVTSESEEKERLSFFRSGSLEHEPSLNVDDIDAFFGVTAAEKASNQLSFEQLSRLFEKDRQQLLFDPNVWESTLRHKLSRNKVFHLLRLRRYFGKFYEPAVKFSADFGDEF